MNPKSSSIDRIVTEIFRGEVPTCREANLRSARLLIKRTWKRSHRPGKKTAKEPEKELVDFVHRQMTGTVIPRWLSFPFKSAASELGLLATKADKRKVWNALIRMAKKHPVPEALEAWIAHQESNCPKSWHDFFEETIIYLLWLARFQRTGENAAAQEILNGIMPKLKELARMLEAGREADGDDLLQEGLLAVFKGLGSFDFKKGLFWRSYFTTIAYNAMCKNWGGDLPPGESSGFSMPG